MPTERVTDPGDPRLDDYLRLTDTQLRSRLDPERARLVCESETAVRVALDSGVEPLSLLVSERRLPRLAGLVSLVEGRAPVYAASDEVIEATTGYRVHRGVLCAMRRPAPAEPERVVEGVRRVAVLEGLTDASNVGAAFRCAAALGVDAVLVDPTCADPLGRRSVRVSMGTVFRVPWARLGEGWPEDGLAMLRRRGFLCCALALDEDALPLDDPRLAAADRLAMLLGSEGCGLAPQTVAACDASVTIPMDHGVDSLNVAACAAVAFWELCRRGRG